MANHHNKHVAGSTVWISEILYGKVVVTSLIIGLEDKVDKPLLIIEILTVSIIVLALARIYVDVFATHIDHGGTMTFSDVLKIPGKIAPICVGLVVPVFLFLGCYLGYISLNAAFRGAKISALAMLFGFGMWLGKTTGRRGIRRIGVAILPTAVGMLVIGIKVLAH